MNDRVVQFRVGVVVLATAIIAAILIVLFGDADSVWKSHKTIYVKFREAPGITVDSPVRKSGILIGRVSAVDFAPDGQILVTIKIDESVKLYRTDRARIRTSLLGDATLEFVPMQPAPGEEEVEPGEPFSRRGGGVLPATFVVAQAPAGAPLPTKQPIPPAEPPLIEEGEVLQGEVVPSPTDIMVNLEDRIGRAADALTSAGQRVDQLAGRIDNFLGENDEQLNRLLSKSEMALDSFTRTMGTFDELFGDEQFRESLRRALEDLPELLAETRQAMVGIQRTAALADENLTNLRGFTAPLGERGPAMVQRIESGVANLDELLEQLSDFSRAMNNREGSLGQLIHNPDLYQSLHRAALNIQSASQQLQPIIHDVRVFTDKIARDPGRLGVSGALRNNAPIK